jgi:hypothetical protein
MEDVGHSAEDRKRGEMSRPTTTRERTPDPGPQSRQHQQAPAAAWVIDEAGRQLRAPWAAAIAGLLFSLLFTTALVLMRSQALYTATSDQELAEVFASGGDLPAVIGGLYLAPFSGIMFLWFVAVIRDQIGEREDRFFATVFFGSGLLFVGLVFAAAAVVSTPLVSVRYLGLSAPTAVEMEHVRSFAYTILFAFATRAGGVFLMATATVGTRSRAFPPWVAWTGYVLGTALMVAVAFWDWVILVLPAWVAVVSLFVLRRERARPRD